MIALDIETTGLYPDKHCMISLGAVGVNVDQQFYGECTIYEDSEISDKALEINGFSESEIKQGNVLPHQLYFRFLKWCIKHFDDYLLIGQNLPSFDVQFLKHYHYEKLYNKFDWVFGHRYIDLHSYVFAKTGKSQSHDDTLEMLGLEKEPKPHNALTGAKIVKEIYNKLN